jgi:hypothetical protein
MAIFDLKNAVIKIKDGTPTTPLEITINIGEGTLSYSEKRNLNYRKNRGVLDDVVLGDEEPVDVQIDAIWEYIRADTGDSPSIEDAVKKKNEAISWISSDSNLCRPYAVDIEIVLTPVCAADKIETITLSDFRYEEINHNANDGTLSLTGKCNITEAVVARTAQS